MADDPTIPPEQPAAPDPQGGSAEDLAAEALAAAQEAVAALSAQAPDAPAPEAAAREPSAPASPGPDASAQPQPQPLSIPDFGDMPQPAAPAGIALLSDVNLNVKIELGRTRMLVQDVLKLGDGSVVELDKLAGDPVDVYVNDRHIARGEVLVLNDNFCVRINEILAPVVPAAAVK
ncbi:MAG: flagellar motor switch protein FliN [Planctomycetota bacterium]|nr:flagellar motor switch protein FliN [Planctomycetota bacterium]